MCSPASRGEHTNHSSSPRGDLDTELHANHVRPAMLQRLANGCNHSSDRLGKIRQLGDLDRCRHSVRERNILSAAKLARALTVLAC
jgi:hypothetical protein